MGMYDDEEYLSYPTTPPPYNNKMKKTEVQKYPKWHEWWFEETSKGKYAKYWIAKEMAIDCCKSVTQRDWYWGGNFVFSNEKFINKLTQILKKEWFRNV